MAIKNKKDLHLFKLASSAIIFSILDGLGINYCVIDSEGYYIAQNNIMISNISHGLEKAEQIDKASWENCKNVMKSGKRITVEESYEDKHYLSLKQPLMGGNKPLGIIIVSFDITDRKRYEKELLNAKEHAEAANRAKTEFLENMRHNIRTPLAGIVGSANILKEEHDELKIREYVDSLITSSHALGDFLNGILEAVREETRETPLSKNKFSLKKCLTDMVDLNQAKATYRGLDLQLDYDPHIPTYLIGDTRRVQRIVLELITNALKFTEKGYVKVSAKLAKKQDRAIIVKIVVCDTGIGIPPDLQQEIFTRFKRLTPSYEGTYEGSGLGLSIVKKFIDDLNAEIYVNSKLGEGSIFTCVIPLEEALLDEDFGAEVVRLESILAIPPLKPDKKQKVAKSEQPSRNTEVLSHVLLVEDNTIAAKVAMHLLESLHCQIDHAPDGETAMTLAEQKRYDLIFMDMGLPDISGIEVTTRIRQNARSINNSTPIIALTAHVDVDDKKRCVEAGMKGMLSKPLLKETAIDILDAFIPHRHEIPTTEKFLEKRSYLATKIIDFDLAKKAVGGKEAVIIDMLEMLKDSLPSELEQFQSAYKKEDWSNIQALAHKLCGGCSYCGTMRLKDACARLETAIKNKKMKMAKSFYKKTIAEIKVLEVAISNKDY